MGCLFQINFDVIMIVALGNENHQCFITVTKTPFWYNLSKLQNLKKADKSERFLWLLLAACILAKLSNGKKLKTKSTFT